MEINNRKCNEDKRMCAQRNSGIRNIFYNEVKEFEECLTPPTFIFFQIRKYVAFYTLDHSRPALVEEQTLPRSDNDGPGDLGGLVRSDMRTSGRGLSNVPEQDPERRQGRRCNKPI